MHHFERKVTTMNEPGGKAGNRLAADSFDDAWRQLNLSTRTLLPGEIEDESCLSRVRCLTFLRARG
jgi:hypothetical protein